MRATTCHHVLMSHPAPRDQIAALPAYVPGARGNPDALPPIKLSSNESPDGPLPSVLDTIARAATSVNRYPDMAAVELHERIAAAHGVAPDQVAVAGGSVAVLAHLLQAFAGPGDEVVFAWRSFEAYPILTAVAGATAVTVPLTADARHDIPAMASAVGARTKVVLLCSPNNPTGPALSMAEFEQFMAAVPRGVLVVLDEAYLEFVRDPQAVAGLDVLSAHPNLVLLRTFSKAYGLAGLRVGYALGAREVIAPLKATITPFSVSSIAQAAAVASLDARDELLSRVDAVVAERDRVVRALREAGWPVPDAQGNFVWLPVGDQVEAVMARLGARQPAILARPFAGDGVRVSIGTGADDDALLEALGTAPEAGVV